MKIHLLKKTVPVKDGFFRGKARNAVLGLYLLGAGLALNAACTRVEVREVLKTGGSLKEIILETQSGSNTYWFVISKYLSRTHEFLAALIKRSDDDSYMGMLYRVSVGSGQQYLLTPLHCNESDFGSLHHCDQGPAAEIDMVLNGTEVLAVNLRPLRSSAGFKALRFEQVLVGQVDTCLPEGEWSGVGDTTGGVVFASGVDATTYVTSGGERLAVRPGPGGLWLLKAVQPESHGVLEAESAQYVGMIVHTGSSRTLFVFPISRDNGNTSDVELINISVFRK